ncbi:5'-nucleotidase-like protein [Tamilnaduibacter salinus]|uniref:5'-nucleotidase-like protein n=1 Tax=Tamilnaduibacter salinus TaxID=1484056 RepID=A0A2U1CZ73_9GAMM|nr:5'-nucleotidase [Tamilnaduibacter salinus]PVY78082.1 5'-nucleotidase-like protein [Tamilnaduibacter salinus]
MIGVASSALFDLERPSHERAINRLEQWGVSASETFFLGGMRKERILQVLQPPMCFDDQRTHLTAHAAGIPMAHIPFGIANIP